MADKHGIYFFLREDIEGRGRLIYHHGVFLLDYSIDQVVHYLYDMGGYYAEVCMDYNTGQVESVNAFTRGAKLDAFLEQIALLETTD